MGASLSLLIVFVFPAGPPVPLSVLDGRDFGLGQFLPETIAMLMSTALAECHFLSQQRPCLRIGTFFEHYYCNADRLYHSNNYVPNPFATGENVKDLFHCFLEARTRQLGRRNTRFSVDMGAAETKFLARAGDARRSHTETQLTLATTRGLREDMPWAQKMDIARGFATPSTSAGASDASSVMHTMSTCERADHSPKR